MKQVLVTGGNKGIGFAIVQGFLKKGYYVFLGSRDVGRGIAAVKSLDEGEQKHVEVVQLDVTDEASVNKAAESVALKCKDDKLFCLVNNAGGNNGARDKFTQKDVVDTVEMNLGGVIRTTTAFLPLLAKNGRIVNISSGAAPNFVATLSVDRQKLFLAVEEQTKIAMEQIHALVDEVLILTEKLKVSVEAFRQACRDAGLGEGSAYGLSKACINAYTIVLAREYPGMKINACSPGFIETDLTKKSMLSFINNTPAEKIGWKPADEGAKSALYLATDDSVSGSGWYFGSDAKRSPPHVYREPGTPAYTGNGTLQAASVSSKL